MSGCIKRALYFFLLISVFLWSPLASAVDIHGDGYDEIFLYSSGNNRVSVHKQDGSLISIIPIPETGIADDPVLFQARWNNTPIVYSFIVNENNTGRLIAFGPNGRIGTFELDTISQSTIMVIDIAGGRSSDIIFTNKQKQSFQIIDPIENNGRRTPLNIRVKKGLRLSVLDVNGKKSFITYGKRRKAKRPTVYPSDGSRYRLASRLPKNALIYPLHNRSGYINEAFTSETPVRNGATYQFLHGDSGKTKFSSIGLITQGHFIGSNSKAGQFAVLGGFTVYYFSVDNPDVEIGRSQLTFGNSGPPKGGDGSGGGGTGPKCNSTFPQARVNEAIKMYEQGRFQELQRALDWFTDPARNFCPEVMERLYKILDSFRGNRTAKLPSDVAILGNPIYVTGKDERKIGGCTKIRGNSDGPGGFVSKPESDKDGKFVTLAPASFFTEEAYLMRPKLKQVKIEKLQYRGRTNGGRPTFGSRLGKHQLPSRAVIKFVIRSFGRSSQTRSSETSYCYLVNPRVRND